MNKDILNLKGEKTGQITLSEPLSRSDVKLGSLYYRVISENSNIHQGTVFKKSRALVRGGGRKPYQQKHTGRARQGSIRAPHYKGGGRAFGNQRKNYKFRLPEGLRRHSLLVLFNQKFRQDYITLIEDFKLKTPKAREFGELFRKFIKEPEKTVLVVLEPDENLKRAAANRADVEVFSVKRIRAVDLLHKKRVLMTKSAAEYLNALEVK